MPIKVTFNELIIAQQSGALAGVEKLPAPFKTKYRLGRIVDKAQQALLGYWTAYQKRYRECSQAVRFEAGEDGKAKETIVVNPDPADPTIQWRILPEKQGVFTQEEEEFRKHEIEIAFDPLSIADFGDDIKPEFPLSSILWMFQDAE